MSDKISAGRDITKQLIDEFGVSKVTVSNALRYRHGGSQLQSDIRRRAMALMEENLKAAKSTEQKKEEVL